MVKSLMLLLMFTCSCNNSFIKKNEIRCIKVTQAFPNLNEHGKIISYDTPSVKIYYHKNLLLYQLSYHFDSVVNDVTIVSENRDHYVVTEKDKAYGFDYDEYKLPYERKISMDSLYKIEWIFKIQVFTIFQKNTATLISSKKNTDSGTLHEFYELKGKDDTSMSGTCYMKFSNNLKDISFSLSKELDNLKNMKLCKISIVNNPRYFEEGRIHLDRIETFYKLEEVTIVNTALIMEYFKKYKNDVGPGK